MCDPLLIGNGFFLYPGEEVERLRVFFLLKMGMEGQAGMMLP